MMNASKYLKQVPTGPHTPKCALIYAGMYKAEQNVVYADYLDSGTGGNGTGISWPFLFN